MRLPANEVPTQTQVLDGPRESEKVTSGARLRIAELLQKPFDVRSVAVTGLFILGVLYTMYFTRSVLLPIVLALLLSYLLRPVIRALARLKIPSLISSALVLISLLALVTYGLSSLVTPFAGWLQKAPTGFEELQHKLMPVKQSLAQVAQASGQIEKLAAPESQTAPKVEVQHHPITDMLFVHTPEFIASAVLLLVLLYFLLAYDGVFMSKLIKLLPTLSDKKRAVSIVGDIESHVSRYLVTVTLINICLGVAVGTTVGLLGLQSPVMWGAMVAVLNFVPYLGAHRYRLHDSRRRVELR